jgi:CspA family cold shock protein
MVTIRATVRLWDDEEGWGVLDAPEVPGGCWTHYSAVEMSGYRRLRVGEVVDVVVEQADQDGFAYRAVRCRPADRPAGEAADPGADLAPGAYRSTLTLTFDPPPEPPAP